MLFSDSESVFKIASICDEFWIYHPRQKVSMLSTWIENTQNLHACLPIGINDWRVLAEFIRWQKFFLEQNRTVSFFRTHAHTYWNYKLFDRWRYWMSAKYTHLLKFHSIDNLKIEWIHFRLLQCFQVSHKRIQNWSIPWNQFHLFQFVWTIFHSLMWLLVVDSIDRQTSLLNKIWLEHASTHVDWRKVSLEKISKFSRRYFCTILEEFAFFCKIVNFAC